MIIIPAIDIKNGKCDRLYKGDYSKETIYNNDPLEVALHWQKKSNLIHIVNLDGAKDGTFQNKKIIETIIQTVQVPVQIGGGIRTIETIDYLISIQTKYIILGTSAIKDTKLLTAALKKYPDSVTVSIDGKNGRVMTEGWLEESSNTVVETFKSLETMGVKRFIYTDTTRDGTLSKPNFIEIKKLREVIKSQLIIAGGISSNDDIETLSKIGIDGVIVGKALYEGKVVIPNLIRNL